MVHTKVKCDRQNGIDCLLDEQSAATRSRNVRLRISLVILALGTVQVCKCLPPWTVLNVEFKSLPAGQWRLPQVTPRWPRTMVERLGLVNDAQVNRSVMDIR